MNHFPSSAEVQQFRVKYPPGTRIRLVHMEDTYSHLQCGDEGTVGYVDDAGQIHMRWDCGSLLALIPGVDKFEALSLKGD